jgi:hypothetical protein
MLLLIAHVLLLTAHRSLLIAHKIASLLASLFVFNNTDKFKWLHDLVVGICWSMDEHVVIPEI